MLSCGMGDHVYTCFSVFLNIHENAFMWYGQPCVHMFHCIFKRPLKCSHVVWATMYKNVSLYFRRPLKGSHVVWATMYTHVSLYF